VKAERRLAGGKKRVQKKTKGAAMRKTAGEKPQKNRLSGIVFFRWWGK